MKNNAVGWMSTVVAILFLLLLAGCGGGSSASMSGNWQFTLTSTSGGSPVTGTTALQQSGNNITGTLTFAANPFSCTPTASVAGTLNGSSISLTILEGTHPQTATATVNTALTSMSGTYTGGCTSPDSGSFAASKQ